MMSVPDGYIEVRFKAPERGGRAVLTTTGPSDIKVQYEAARTGAPTEPGLYWVKPMGRGHQKWEIAMLVDQEVTPLGSVDKQSYKPEWIQEWGPKIVPPDEDMIYAEPGKW